MRCASASLAPSLFAPRSSLFNPRQYTPGDVIAIRENGRAEAMAQGWRGVFTIPVTPFDERGELDEASLKRQGGLVRARGGARDRRAGQCQRGAVADRRTSGDG